MIGGHQQVYKRYSTHVKRNNILLLKQKDKFNDQLRQDQNQDQPQKEQNLFKENIIFKPTNQKNLEPIILKRFEQYFQKSNENTKNSRIFNQFIQHQTVKIDKNRRTQKAFTYTSTKITSLIETQNNLDRKRFIKERRSKNNSSISKYENDGPQSDEKYKSLILDQNFTDPNMPDVKLKPLNLASERIRKIERLNNSIDLSKLLNKTLIENNTNIENQLNTLISKMQEADCKTQDYLKIQSSILVDRKTISPLLKSFQEKKIFSKDDIRKSIRKKAQNRNHVFDQIYKDKIRSRSPSPSKVTRKVNFLDFMNPLRRQQFALMDVIKVSLVNSMIDQVKFNMNGCFFCVFVQQGNNSELIKSLVRSTNGWRVSELIQVSNLVWTQNYRKNLSNIKPKKIFKSSIPQDQNMKNKNKQRSNSDFTDNQGFLIKKVQLTKNIGSNKSLERKSLQKIKHTDLNNKISNVTTKKYPQLILLNQRTQFQQTSYENQLQKLLPQQYKFQNFVLRSQKEAKKINVNPNLLIHNHLIGHRAISDKKNLLFNLKKFYFSQKIYPFEYIPQSHDIFTQDDEFIIKRIQNFLNNHQQSQTMKKETWIVKPGEDSNRGRGIMICKGWQAVLSQIGKRFKEKKSQKKGNQKQIKQTTENQYPFQEKNKFQRQRIQTRSVILQRYIIPLLYQGRKFDIRSYMLVTWVNNVLNGYFYDQCYIRTSSKLFDINSQNKYVHLTNDAIQSLSHDYGKYEEGNKVSQMVFSRYFESLSKKNKKSWDDIKIEMSYRCKHILKSSSKKLVGRFGQRSQDQVKQSLGFCTDSSFIKMIQTQKSQRTTQKGSFLFPNNQLKQQQISFQLFGLDFMIDQNLKLWLIEVNTNPAITHDCSRVLNRLIPKLLDNTFAIAVMPFMRPSKIPQNISYHNCYHHIYQEKIDP